MQKIQYTVNNDKLFLYLHKSPKVHRMNSKSRSKITYLVVF